MKRNVFIFIAILFSMFLVAACNNSVDTNAKTAVKTAKELSIGDTLTVVVPFNSGHGVTPGCDVEKGATLKIIGILSDKTLHTVYTPKEVWGGGNAGAGDRCPNKENIYLLDSEADRITQ